MSRFANQTGNYRLYIDQDGHLYCNYISNFLPQRGILPHYPLDVVW